jgi:hypothetical protein
MPGIKPGPLTTRSQRRSAQTYTYLNEYKQKPFLQHPQHKALALPVATRWTLTLNGIYEKLNTASKNNPNWNSPPALLTASKQKTKRPSSFTMMGALSLNTWNTGLLWLHVAGTAWMSQEGGTCSRAGHYSGAIRMKTCFISGIWFQMVTECNYTLPSFAILVTHNWSRA